MRTDVDHNSINNVTSYSVYAFQIYNISSLFITYLFCYLVFCCKECCPSNWQHAINQIKKKWWIYAIFVCKIRNLKLASRHSVDAWKLMFKNVHSYSLASVAHIADLFYRRCQLNRQYPFDLWYIIIFCGIVMLFQRFHLCYERVYV